MPRILPLQRKEYTSEIKISFIQHETVYSSRINNTKATLGHSPLAFKVYMEWYPLFQEVKGILGIRLGTIFAWTVSEAANCLVSTAYFRKDIIQAGEQPEELNISPREQELLNFGIAVAQSRSAISDELYKPIQERYSAREIVILTTFTGMIVATSIFNNVIGVEIDEDLAPYLPKHQLV